MGRDSLTHATKTNLDLAAGGVLMSKSIFEAYKLIEEMASNQSQ